jgi:hypothetical protein
MSAIPPKADIAERRCHVRFVPKADICTAAFFPYLITSSAQPSSDSGTVIPRVRAVLRFTTSVLFTLFSRMTLGGTQQ